MSYQDEVETSIKIVEHNDTYVICAGRKAMEALQEMVKVYPKHADWTDTADEQVIAAFKSVYVP